MSWVGDLLKAGINATGNTITFNKAVKFANTATFESTTTVPDNTITVAKLAAAVQDLLVELSIAAVDGTNGTATVTIQAKDAEGNDLADTVMLRVWTGGADDYGVDALTGITASTGTVVNSHTANGDVDVVTDENGTAVLAMNNGVAGSIYVWAAIQGRVYASGEIAITSV
jgi:hypothetical protein